MPVFGVKVGRKDEGSDEEVGNIIDWPGEIRSFIGDKIEQVKREANLKDVEKLLSGVPPSPRGTASRLVRGDRDSGH